MGRSPKSFQSLFPPLSPHTLALSSARRVVLIAYNPDRGTVDFRHYVITVKPYGVSKRVRRVLEGAQKAAGGILDLGNEKDVADFLLRKRGEVGPDGGYESAASSGAESVAGDDADAVDLADDYVGRNNKKGQRRAVRLDEVGPRMELRLEGSVIYHEFGKEIASEGQSRSGTWRGKKAAKGKSTGGDNEDEEDEGEDEEMVSEGGEDEDEPDWDAEEEISEGEDSEEEEPQDSSDSEEEEQRRPPAKKVRIKGKR
ncbi:hypothetical protein B0H14DRAFT_3046448 [Mycena olivaceomarginata]|nr:hypothetical protein B0H14DRAFT_3046448 [Mycena olivaceomarginata]